MLLFRAFPETPEELIQCRFSAVPAAYGDFAGVFSDQEDLHQQFLYAYYPPKWVANKINVSSIIRNELHYIPNIDMECTANSIQYR